MKQKYLLAVLLVSSFLASTTTDAMHHEKVASDYEKGQQAVHDAFGWDFSKAEITTENALEIFQIH